MQSLFPSFTWKSLVRRRKQWRFRFCLYSTLIAFLFLITAIYSTTQYLEYEEAKKTYGSWDFSVYETSCTTINKLKENVLIESLGTMSIYGTIKTNDPGSNNYLGTMDDTAKELTGLTFEQGTYPETPYEIALEKDLLLRLGLDDKLGQMVTLTYTNSLGNSETLTFRLCGIVNSYHNTYLKQGPLVTGFVCNSMNSSIKLQQYINTFIKLKKNYTSEHIMKDIQSAVFDSSKDTEEHWYYNTYIQTKMGFPYQPFLILVCICQILSVILYHRFFFYYKNRYAILINSQLMGLNKQKIFHIFLQEALVFTFLVLVGGVFLGTIFGSLYHIIGGIFLPNITFYTNKSLLLGSLILALVTLILGIFAPLIHAYILFNKKPKLRLPTPVLIKPNKKYSKCNTILLRILKVYKSDFIYYIVLYVVALVLLIGLSLSGAHLYHKISLLSSSKTIDYTIGNSPFDSSGHTQTKELLPTKYIDKLNSLDEIKVVQKYRYAFVKSTPIVELSLQTNTDTQTEKKYQSSDVLDELFMNVDYLTSKTCIAYIPDDYNDFGDEQLFTHTPSIGDTISITYKGQTTLIKITNIIGSKEFQRLTNSEVSGRPCIFCNENTFNTITLSSYIETYNYVTVIYNDSSNEIVTTNIIDSIMFCDQSFHITHDAIENGLELTSYTRWLVFDVFSVIFLALIFSSILDSHQSSCVEYLSYQIKLFWYMGLSKKNIRKASNRCFLLLLSVSLIFANIIFFLLAKLHLCIINKEELINFIYLIDFKFGCVSILSIICFIFLQFYNTFKNLHNF